MGTDSNVLIDLGIASGIQPGDQLTIFRYATGADYGIRPQGSYWVYTQPEAGVEVPRTYLGDLAVLYVGDRWAMARVIDSSRLIEVGDQVELK
jgi:secreted trypsin-like serine protease